MGLVYLYHGTGAGKTTNALGLALREVGHKQKVVIVQFMKGRKDIGEYKIRDVLKPYYEIHQFGSKKLINLKKPSKDDKEKAQQAVHFAKGALKKKPSLLVLDEAGLAAYFHLISSDEILDVLKKIPEKTDVVITGRYVPKSLLNRADIVNEIRAKKFPKKMVTKKGIQY
jgi:cob(I)alamin adenosyltransferase